MNIFVSNGEALSMESCHSGMSGISSCLHYPIAKIVHYWTPFIPRSIPRENLQSSYFSILSLIIGSQAEFMAGWGYNYLLILNY